MGFPSYKADGSDTYKPPKNYTSEEIRAIRSIARDGQERYEAKTKEQDPGEKGKTYGPLINPQEAQQLQQLKEESALDALSKDLESFGDSPTTRQIFRK